MFCHKCGRQVPNGAKFCDKCGTTLSSDNVSISTPETPKQNPFAEPGSTNASNDSLDNVIKFTCMALMLLAIIFIVFNVGGHLSGIELIQAFFDFSPKSLKYLSSEDATAYVLLFVSHVGVFIWGVIGFFIFFKGMNATLSSFIVLVSGLLGVISGLITGWNVAAEIVSSVSGIVLFILCLHNAAPPTNYDSFYN